MLKERGCSTKRCSCPDTKSDKVGSRVFIVLNDFRLLRRNVKK